MNSERRILVYKDYFLTFYRALEAGAQKKIDYVLDVLKMQDRVSEKFVKYIKEGIYEIRASYNGNIYRAFFIFDEGNIVMLFNGFQKKSQKTPSKEIDKALELKKEYYAGKKWHYQFRCHSWCQVWSGRNSITRGLQKGSHQLLRGTDNLWCP